MDPSHFVPYMKIVLNKHQDFILSHVLYLLTKKLVGISYTLGIAPGVHALMTEDKQVMWLMVIIFYVV